MIQNKVKHVSCSRAKRVDQHCFFARAMRGLCARWRSVRISSRSTTARPRHAALNEICIFVSNCLRDQVSVRNRTSNEWGERVLRAFHIRFYENLIRDPPLQVFFQSCCPFDSRSASWLGTRRLQKLTVRKWKHFVPLWLRSSGGSAASGTSRDIVCSRYRHTSSA